MKKIIDNEPKSNKLERYTLDRALNDLIEQNNYEAISIATGYFNLGAWKLVEDTFLRLKKFRMIIGQEFKNRKMAEEQIKAFIQEELDKLDYIESEKYKKNRKYVLSLISFLTRENPSWKSLPNEIKESHPELKYVAQVKIHPAPFLHGKCYLFKDIVIVGSSNFTYKGLTGNTELNLVSNDEETVNLVKEWFEYFFHSKKSYDYRQTLVDILKNSKFGDKDYDPYWVFLKIVFEYNRHELLEKLKDTDENPVIRLADFQEEGVNRAIQIIESFGGVLIADAVGLGKSFIGGAIIRRLCITKGVLDNRVLVICPAQLSEQWKRNLEQFGIPGNVYSLEKLSRELPQGSYGIILVDESHNFRNPKSRRFMNLRELVQRGRNPNFIFLTATPINVGYMDLYHQLYLLLRARDTALSSILGISNLKEYFKMVEKNRADIHLITDQLIIARSRAFIRYRQKVLKQDVILPNGQKIEFPDRKLRTLRYHILEDIEDLNRLIKKHLPEVYNNYFDNDGNLIDVKEGDDFEKTPSNLFYRIVFNVLQGTSSDDADFNGWKATAFKIESFKIPERQNKEIVKNMKPVVPLMLTTFLKRLESSIECFIKSLNKQITFHKFYLTALEHGYIISSQVWRKYFEKIIDPADLEDIDELGTDIFEGLSEDVDINSLIEQNIITEFNESDFQQNAKTIIKENIIKDYKILEKIRDLAQDIKDMGDKKRDCLKRRIEEIINTEEKHGRKTIIFTIYEDTANYLYDYFCPKDELGKETSIFPGIRIEKITGSVSKSKRKDIINRFAPASNIENEAERISPDDEIDILISTDVLSEGMNLQDAKYVINYDLHWNPVRMIQRAGRIDRLGSLHKEIEINNFFLEKGLENLLKLMERIVNRLRQIDETIELDAPVITEDDLRNGIRRIEDEDVSFIDEEEARLEFLGLTQSKRELQRAIQEMSFKFFSSFPLGLHSGMLTMNYSGLIVAMEFELNNSKRPITKWVFEPDKINVKVKSDKDDKNEQNNNDNNKNNDDNELIDNMVEIEKIIMCSKETKRIVIEPPEEIYKRAARIIKKISKRFKQKNTANKMTKSYEKGNKTIANIFLKAIKEQYLEREKAERFLHYLRNKPFNAIKNSEEIRPIYNKLNENLNKIDELAELDDTIEGKNYRNSLKAAALKEFLEGVYYYFDQNDIELDWKSKNTQQEEPNVRLIGTLRVYTKESYDIISEEYNKK